MIGVRVRASTSSHSSETAALVPQPSCSETANGSYLAISTRPPSKENVKTRSRKSKAVSIQGASMQSHEIEIDLNILQDSNKHQIRIPSSDVNNNQLMAKNSSAKIKTATTTTAISKSTRSSTRSRSVVRVTQNKQEAKVNRSRAKSTVRGKKPQDSNPKATNSKRVGKAGKQSSKSKPDAPKAIKNGKDEEEAGDVSKSLHCNGCSQGNLKENSTITTDCCGVKYHKKCFREMVKEARGSCQCGQEISVQFIVDTLLWF